MATNGNLPSSDLVRIGPGYLEREAASAFIAMQNEARERGLAVPELSGSVSGYRPRADQQHFWDCRQTFLRTGHCSCSNGCALAAVPGTSNHGWGKAVDLKTQAGRATVDKIGAKFGWRKVEAPSEWWHVNYVGGFKGADCDKVLQRGCQGGRVKRFQRLLRSLGNKSVKVDGDFGPSMERAVKRFQRNHKLDIDGKIGPATRRAMIKARRPVKAAPTVKPPTHTPGKPDVFSQEREFAEGLKIAAVMIKPFEGFRSKPYWDRFGKVWTQGYGETKGIGPNSPPVSEKQASANLVRRLRANFLPYVKLAMKRMPNGHQRLNRNRVAALLSLIYNTGPGAIGPGTTIGSALARRDLHAVARGFMLWVKAGGVTLAGLVRRRAAEADRFSKPVK